MSLLPEPAIGNKGLDANLLQYPPEIVTQDHQVEFPTALGKAPHQEMMDTRPDLQGPEGMFDQGTAKAHHLTLVLGHPLAMTVHDIRMFPPVDHP